MYSDVPFEESTEQTALKNAGRALMLRLREAVPLFEAAWLAHLEYWEGEPAGSYIDISEFAHFTDELLVRGENKELARILQLLDDLFIDGDEATRDLIGIGYIEDLQNTLSGRINGYSTVIPLLPPTLLKVWNQIEKQWAGHGSLMEVLEAERAQSVNQGSIQPSPQPTWAELLQLPNL
jgi:hypothetical protein